MIHTFAVYTIISKSTARSILRYMGKKRLRCILKQTNIPGIRSMSLFPRKVTNDYLVKIAVNPAKLLYGKEAFGTVVATQFNDISTQFSKCLKILVGINTMPELENWYVHRIDYAIDVYTDYLSEYLILFDKGDIPKYYRSTKYTAKQGSCYKVGTALNINIYDKAAKLKKDGYSAEVIRKANNILRIEFQCKSRKVGYLKKRHKLNNRYIKNYFNKAFVKEIIYSYCQRIFKTGDYYSFYSAKTRLKLKIRSKKSRTVLLNILLAIAQIGSITKTRKQLLDKGIVVKNEGDCRMIKIGREQFGRHLRKLAILNINPVTIPRAWEIRYLPNILSLIQEKILETEGVA